MKIKHPTKDPTLVSYHRPELEALLASLELALDCWSLMSTEKLGSAKKKYIKREQAEPYNAFMERLDRATYTPIYRDSIKAYAGLLNRFHLVEPPQSLEDHKEDVDLQGSSVQSFFNRADELTIRDGGCYILVEMPEEVQNNNALDEKTDGRRPYLILIERKDVVNWSVQYIGGREVITHATWRQLRQFRDDQGSAYGAKVEPVYHCMKPGEVTSYRLTRNSSVDSATSAWKQEVVGKPKSTSLPLVPLIWYGSTNSRFAQSDLPLNGLAELSVQHFASRSDKAELIRKCALPVPVRKGYHQSDDPNNPGLTIGPNTFMDLPGEGADFSFVEPTGRSLTVHGQEIEHIEMLMDRSGLNFLYGANIKTATEASLRASQVASQVSALVRNKVSVFSAIMRIWAAYMGEQADITPESGIQINDSLINRPLDPSGVAQIINLVNGGLMSKRSALHELVRGGAIDPDTDIEKELQRIADEQPVEETAAPVTQNPKNDSDPKDKAKKGKQAKP